MCNVREGLLTYERISLSVAFQERVVVQAPGAGLSGISNSLYICSFVDYIFVDNMIGWFTLEFSCSVNGIRSLT